MIVIQLTLLSFTIVVIVCNGSSSSILILRGNKPSSDA